MFSHFKRTTTLVVFSVTVFLILIFKVETASAYTSVYSIWDDATGGSCTSIGSWDATTKTCTISSDLISVSSPGTATHLITIEDSNLTLDGNGHTFTGTKNWGDDGIYLSHRVTGVTIKNLKVKQFSSGIHLDQSVGNTVMNNIAEENIFSGILVGTGDVELGNNLIGNVTKNNSVGIYYSQAINSTFSDNVSNSNKTGIYISSLGGNTLRGNTMTGNDRNFSLQTGTPNLDTNYQNDVDTTNLVDGKPIYYLVGATNKVFDHTTNAGLFLCLDCNSITATGLTLSKNWTGVFLRNTENSKFENIVISDTDSGIELFNAQNNKLNNIVISNSVNNNGAGTGVLFSGSSGNTLMHSKVSSNKYVGVWIYESDNNTFTNNEVAMNSYAGIFLNSSDNNIFSYNYVHSNTPGPGINLQYFSSENKLFNNEIADNNSGLIIGNNSDDNSIYNNNFLRNFWWQAQVYGGSDNNAFNLSSPKNGNYWDIFDAVEESCFNVNDDGLCDAPYIFNGGQDNLPWTEQNGWLNLPEPLSISFSPEPGYDGADAIDPDGGPVGTMFTFKVVYTNPDNLPPILEGGIFPAMVDDGMFHIAALSAPPDPNEGVRVFISGPTYAEFTLQRDTAVNPGFPYLHDGDYTNGEQFVADDFQLSFNAPGIYEYHFETFVDGIEFKRFPESGEFTFELTNDANHPPTLEFFQEDGYIDDGVNPNKGTANLSNFFFKILYKDADNDPPPQYVHAVVEKKNEVSGEYQPFEEPYLMFPATDRSYIEGNVFATNRTFPKGQYRYHFETSDGITAVQSESLEFVADFSNVAFLPGIQGSRLYKVDTCWAPTRPPRSYPCQKQLWEPSSNDNVEKLYTSSVTGESLDKGIYTRDIIDEANILLDPTGTLQANFYKKFIAYMDDLADNEGGIVNGWKALPYDWRLDFEQLVQSGTMDGENINYNSGITETPYLLEEIRKLADASKSGNVTIVTHSMGGLIAKTLLTHIAREDHPYHDLYKHIDRLIMVAPPQMGTPKVMEVLLHAGEAQLGLGDIGFLLDEERARESAESMISAYNLLPSKKYFDVVDTPVINFDQSVDRIGALANRAGGNISSFDDFYKFLLGDNGLRQEPKKDDEEYPNVLKSHFLSRAIETHDTILDIWSPPPHMQVVQIAGWGIKTISHITYSCGHRTCFSLSSLDRTVDPMTIQGDGTVVLPSALMMENVDRYYVNIRNYNEEGLFNQRRNRDHGSIFEIDDLQNFIANIIQGKDKPEDGENTKHITKTEPTPKPTDTTIDFTLHSPVEIHLYDGAGNHTGLIPNPDPNSDIRLYEKAIPNSYYFELGEVKYTGADGGEPISVTLKGKDLGTFTLDIDEFQGDTPIDSTTLKNVPITEKTTATLTVQTTDTGIAPVSLNMDIDGNGTNDVTVTPDTANKADVSLAILKKIVQTLDIQKGLKKALVAQIEAAEKAIKKRLPKVAIQILKTMTAQLKNLPSFLISSEDAPQLIKIIDEIQGRLVK